MQHVRKVLLTILSVVMCLCLATSIGCSILGGDKGNGGNSTGGGGDGGRSAVSITIEGPQTIYFGEFRSSDYKVVITWSDNSTTDETLGDGDFGADINKFIGTSATLGSHTVTITKYGKTANYTITVVSAHDGTVGLQFSKFETYASVTGFSSQSETAVTEIVIPKVYADLPVTTIDSNAFANNSSLTKITIPDTITTINPRAFAYCTGLEEITLPDSVSFVGDSAFSGCDNLAKLYFDGSLEQYLQIDIYNENSMPYAKGTALYINNEKVTELDIPETITKIGNYAFCGYSHLTKLKVAEQTEVGNKAFYNCHNVADLTIASFGLMQFDGDGVVNLNIVGEGTQNVSGVSYQGEKEFLEKITIDTSTGFCESTFSRAKALKEVVFGDSVTTIARSLFSGCTALEKITFGENVSAINDGVFYDCTSVKEVYVPSVEKWCTIDFEGYHSAPFYFSKQEVLYYANPAEEFDEEDAYLPVSELVLSNTVTSISDYAFYGYSNLVRLVLPENLLSIGEDAFNACRNLLSVKLPSTLETIGSCAFYDCIKLFEVFNLSENFDIPALSGESNHYGLGRAQVVKTENGESSIIKNYYTGCYEYLIPGTQRRTVLSAIKGEESILISIDVDNIRDNAFYENTDIKTVKMEWLANEIGNYAFYGCENIQTFHFGVDTDGVLGDFKAEYYLDTRFCNEYANPMRYAKEFYFNNQLITELSQLNITTDKIPNYAFIGWKGTSIVIPDCVRTVGDGAFMNCSNATFIDTGDGVTNLGIKVFQECTKVERAILGDSVSYVNERCFTGCSNLMSITFGKSIGGVGSQPYHYSGTKIAEVFNFSDFDVKLAFEADLGITDFVYITDPTVQSTITTDEDGFVTITLDSGDVKLINYKGTETEIVIPSNVTVIGNYLFNDNDDIVSVVIPEGVKSIGKYAFYDCNNLVSVDVPDSLEVIGDYAFYMSNNITEMTLGDNIKRIGENAFNSSSPLMENVDNVGYIGKYAVYGWQPETITIREGTILLADHLFSNKSFIATVSLPEGLKYIGRSAFQSTESITSINIPSTVIYIGDYAFRYTSISEVTLPDNLEYLGRGAFSDIEELVKDNHLIVGDVLYRVEEASGDYTIASNIRVVAEFALSDLNGITSITVPSNVEEIGEGAFRPGYEKDLKKVTFNKGLKKLGNMLFHYNVNNSDYDVQVYFNGTINEWNEIEKEPYWYAGLNTNTVICSDGEVGIRMSIEEWNNVFEQSSLGTNYTMTLTNHTTQGISIMKRDGDKIEVTEKTNYYDDGVTIYFEKDGDNYYSYTNVGGSYVKSPTTIDTWNQMTNQPLISSEFTALGDFTIGDYGSEVKYYNYYVENNSSTYLEVEFRYGKLYRIYHAGSEEGSLDFTFTFGDVEVTLPTV